MVTRITLNQDIVQWAIRTSDLSKEDIYKKHPALKNNSPCLTINQLKKLAKDIRVSFVNLFLGIIPPEEPLPIPDFRTKNDAHVHNPSLNLRDIIWIMEYRQEWMREYLISQFAQPLSFVGELSRIRNPYRAAERIRNILNINIDWKQDISSMISPLNYFRDKIEDIGVMVFFESGLDNTARRRFNPDEFRGFVMQDPIAPLLFVNAADSQTAQLFTIIHEFVHLCRGGNGIINFDDDDSKESFCNQTAAEILLPRNIFLSQWKIFNNDFDLIAKQYKVSPLVVARRARDFGLISNKAYWDFHTIQQKQYVQQNKSVGGNYYNTRHHHLSKFFSYSVVIAERYGQISFRDAYKLLGLSGKTFDKFAGDLQ